MNTITTWEYKIVENPTPSQLTALGAYGWELVAVPCTVSGFSRSERAYFKRPKSAGVPPLLELAAR